MDPPGDSNPPVAQLEVVDADEAATAGQALGEVDDGAAPNNGSKRRLRTWEDMFQCLVKYKEQNDGSVAVPRQYPPDKNLGEWVVKVRMFQRKLTAEQRKKLEDIGFSFESRLEGYERKWNEMFEELKAFHKKNGHCIVPESERSEKDGIGKLARWVHYQRKHQWKMSQERQDKLNELGFVWKRYTKKPGEKRKDPDTTKLDARWMAHYDKLKAFFEENGHSNLLQDHHDQPLYFWFKTQRTLMHQGLLRKDRKLMLDSVKMVWDTKETLNQQWEEKFRRALEYKKEHGTINCPHRMETHGLGNWIAYQKRSFREGLIEPDRARRLLDADMTYIAEKDYSWNDRMAKLKLLDSWSELAKDPELERWARLQLVLKDCNKLSRDRRVILESIKFERFAAMPGGPLYQPPPAQTMPLLPTTTVETTIDGTTTQAMPSTATNAVAAPPVHPEKPAADPTDDTCTKDTAGPAVPTAEPTTVDQPTRDEPKAASAATVMTADSPLVDEQAAPAPARRGRGRPRKHPVKVRTKQGKRTWDQSFAALVEYKEKHGTAKLPSEYPEDAALLKWTKMQRTYKHSLSEEQINKLEGIGFTLDGCLAIRERKWEEKFEKLQRFIEEKGNALVTNSDDKELRIWVGDQRKKFSYGTLRQDRIDRLNAVGFVWNAQPAGAKKKPSYFGSANRQAEWNLQYEKLCDFKKLHGHCDVKSDDPDKEFVEWIKKQRLFHQQKKLPEDWVEKLNKLGFLWRHKEHTDEVAWNAKFDMLRHYKEKEGHCDVPVRHKKWGLGGWCATQRFVFRFGDMNPKRARKLIDLGFPLILEHENSWQGRYKKLKELTTLDELWKDPPLQRWVGLQRCLVETNSLPPDRKQLLLDIKLLWEMNNADKQNSESDSNEAEDMSIDEAVAGSTQDFETAIDGATTHRRDRKDPPAGSQEAEVQ